MLTCHFTVGVGLPPVAAAVNVADAPSHFVASDGLVEIVGAVQHVLLPNVLLKEKIHGVVALSFTYKV